MISFTTKKGAFKNTDSFFEKMLEVVNLGALDKYGKLGVEALKNNTPMDTGRLANSWGYDIVRENGLTRLIWTNDDIENGFNVAILLQYGHGTKNGYWIEGIDYINPALEPVFNEIAENAWEEVKNV